ncbi:hypothetical protein [Spirillospora albida]|uniref:hypothetical protein n=1 Tax=Spirillospora albida TaxID=58123 RepID=UPI00068F3170|nr:hypothetical protein [Spirillospora albida]
MLKIPVLRTAPKNRMVADYLRPYAQWRINRADPRDDGRNARAAIALIDAAAYALLLEEDERVIVRMAIAGCFASGRFDPGPEGERLVRFWHYDEVDGSAADLLEAVAACAERGLQACRSAVPATGAGRGPLLRRPRAAALA